MGEFHGVRVGDRIISPIDWEMCPELTFGTFESWGGRERVRSNAERIYYFFIDRWGGEDPKLFLMERGVKHARIVAEIIAPREMVAQCVNEQGWAARFEQTFGINDEIREWLIKNVLDGGDSSLVIPIEEEKVVEDMGKPLPRFGEVKLASPAIALPTEPAFIQEEEMEGVVKRWNFFDGDHNPEGRFDNCLVQAKHESAVIDLQTNLMWQKEGIDINSHRKIVREINALNKEGFAGYHDWRMPTVEEALSLMEPLSNLKEMHLNPCFSAKQPFIFVAAQRKPGGYWFVDYKQGRAFWSSGTIPGGFARLVRSI